MRSTGRKLLNFGLIAVYGGIAVLGQGLHELSSVHHHHHAGLAHDHSHCTGHSHQHSPVTEGPSVSDWHDCEICVFLDQMRSDQPQVVAEVTCQQLVARVSITTPHFVSETALGLHAARGPPTLFG